MELVSIVLSIGSISVIFVVLVMLFVIGSMMLKVFYDVLVENVIVLDSINRMIGS